ncbi:MAG: squalene/phytoene synthase family protein [Bacteroidales bacterium]|nr:squalene/phytoene synthase family protein [Bacteroidales bacterium]MDD3907550.1 squalene/phytoene synthase family protein [Bacteroidales bacterium]MDD4712889.1 squalene/phytoene synthase family protein [Bacteroidales bacterium]
MDSQTNLYLEIFNVLDFDKIKDHPNILIAAHFWDEERYDAAKTCYRLMRAIDDLVDNYKTEHIVIAENEKRQLITDVESWIGTILHQSNSSPVTADIVETFNKFLIPSWPMEAFAKSMIYDINHDGFPTIQSFMDYAEGASIAPASIFVHLCGIKKTNGQYTVPAFDVKEAATSCAIFSYIVHIIRDFQKDQYNHLNYFADDILVKNGLNRKKLNDMAHGGKMEEGFRNLIREYYSIAEDYRQKTYDMILRIKPCLEPRYQLSLEIIFNLYLMVFERIDIKNGSFTGEELNPTAEEIKKRVYETIQGFKCSMHHS